MDFMVAAYSRFSIKKQPCTRGPQHATLNIKTRHPDFFYYAACSMNSTFTAS